MNELNSPRWNLDSIFPSIESPEYKQALNDYTTGMERLENLLHTSHGFNFSFWLKGYLEQEEKVLILAKTLHAYSYIIYSVDTTNTAFLNNIAFIDELSLRLKKIDFEFKSRLVKNSKKLEDFFTRFPQFKEHKFILEEKIAETKHRMSLKEEELASKLQRTGGDAWDRLHEQLISNLKDESGKTFNTLRNDAYSSDPILRKSSYEKELALLKQHKIAFAACLNNLKGETIALNSKRKWKTALNRSLFASRLDKKTLTALIKSIEKSLPLWRKYFLTKATFLKKNALTASTATDSNGKTAKGLAFYDLFAPLDFSANKSNKSQLIDEKINAAEIQENNLNQSTSEEETKNASPLSKTWTFKEARTYIISRYESFSQEMGNFARRVFAENWIDAEVRQGKVGGAYDEDFALGHQSRIMTNFTGAFSDVITLAHEIGHAFHFYCLRGKPASFFNYPMTLAETASTFAETIVKQSMLKECSQIEKLQLLDMDLQDAGQVLVDILCRFYFEKSVFEQRTKGELSAEDFCTLMKDAQQKSYGKGLNSERHEYMWAVKSHYYSTDLDFYNFPYAFGQLFAAGLYQKYLKEGESFAKTYKNLLSNTGSMKSEALCALAGFDISTTDFWNLGIEMYQKEIEEFCDLVKKATD
ncbi:M3 family oligoendopeptidase [Treponema pectinovorum]|uniref:M3 family oligoendopeptidase n=1 Tax=Treponema pectinovorum TaxID=164 RepID=UPI0011CA9607|nr:M3 family oligoendopeptidase [Treponema pectinovorum]